MGGHDEGMMRAKTTMQGMQPMPTPPSISNDDKRSSTPHLELAEDEEVEVEEEDEVVQNVLRKHSLLVLTMEDIFVRYY